MKFSGFKRIPESESRAFDVVRAMSAIFVLVGHIYQILILPSFSSPLATRFFFVLAGYSVMTFFVISGYMIGLSIYRNLSKNSFNHFDVSEFAFNRIVRLYPPLILSLSICVVVSILAISLARLPAWMNDATITTLSKIEPSLIGSLFFLQNMLRGALPPPVMNFPLWSLSFEFWFYVIIALAITAIANKQRTALAAFVALTCFIFYFGRWESFYAGFLVWMSGFIAAIARQNFSLSSGRPLIVLLLSTGITGLFWCTLFLRIVDWPSFEAKYAFGLFCCLSAVTALELLPETIAITSRSRTAVAVAGVAPFSFTLYLIHYPILLVVGIALRHYTDRSLAVLFVAAAASFCAIVALSKVLSLIVENRSLVVRALKSAPVRV